MKVFFDQNVPLNLRRHMVRHEVKTADELGWGRIENGELIQAAEADGFQVFVTCDQNIAYQQNLKDRLIAIVEITKNNWPSVKPHIGEIVRAVETGGVGGYKRVMCQYVYRPRKRMSGWPL